ncbi:MAG: pilus assembly protein N-terminal domain-containing protein [Pseudomonadales bacterium]|nr:pilus assembly protein N-terminal domain-containing protein [Pseudomonadales bacterium]
MQHSLSVSRIVALVLTYILSCQQLYAADGYEKTVTVVQGQTRLLPYQGVMRVSIGHPDVANAQATGPDEILLTGLKAGVTDLRIWTDYGKQKRFLLRVVDNSWVQVMEIANIVLADVEGVNAREENGVVFIEGRVLREQDLDIIKEMKQKLSKEIGSGTVVFNVVKPSVSLQAMVMMDVQVVEVRRNELKNIGIRWSTAASGPGYEFSGGFRNFFDFDKSSSSFGIASSVVSTLNFLQTEGVARVLAQPKLVTRSGSSAEFLVGGEVPIPIKDNDGALSVTFKQVGVIMKMKPVTDPDGFIATAIEVEVSAVDDSVQVQDIPGFTTRRTKMEMNVQNGQTMVISGMLQADDTKALDKVPGLSAIPVVGELFKSRDFQERTTELVIFVTPYLIDPDSKMNKDLLQYSQDLSSDAGEDIRSWSIWD